jgi:hypothetical protein
LAAGCPLDMRSVPKSDASENIELRRGASAGSVRGACNAPINPTRDDEEKGAGSRDEGMKSVAESISEDVALMTAHSDKENGTSSRRTYCLRLILRWLIVTGCALFAYWIPDLGLLISVVGSVGATAVALVCPPLLYWKIVKPSFGTKCGIAAFSAAGFACGCLSFAMAVSKLKEGD